MTYTKLERIAIARIISDIVRADNIIARGELSMLNRLKTKYHLTSEDQKDARKNKTFAAAVSDLTNMSNEQKKELFKDIKGLALADGACVPREAVLLLAFSFCLGITNMCDLEVSINSNPVASILSCPTEEPELTNRYVVYVEGCMDEAANRSIQDNLELIVLKLRQWGFDFIYIPVLIDEFKRMDKDYVRDVIYYMAPDLTDKTVDDVYNRLLSMDTATFCNRVLADKLKVDSIKNTSPSLLISIGSSLLPYCSENGQIECYTEFLHIPLKDDVRKTIEEFVMQYSQIVSFYTTTNPINTLGNIDTGIKYFGFYKSLFDFLVKAEPKESEIVIDPYNNRLDFPKAALSLKLAPQQASVYKLVLHYTYNTIQAGLPTCGDWVNIKGKKEDKRNLVYDRIYRTVSECKDTQLPDNLAPIRSKIESKMREHLSTLSNLNDYIPVLENGKYVVKARPDKILIKQLDKVVDITMYNGWTIG